MKLPRVVMLGCTIALIAASYFAIGPDAKANSSKSFQLAANTRGYDSMAILPNGKFYATFGNQYLRASLPDLTIDPGYPKPIAGNWGALPASFNQGFDSMSVLSNGMLYVTKGNQYVKYLDAYGTKLAPGYPKPIAGNWGALPANFNQGFDSMGILPNGMLYVTKGNQYVKYTDGLGSTVAPGYPRQIAGNWGNLPASFNTGFDSIESFGGLTYVTRYHQFVRYSDKAALKVDPGYPMTIN